MKYIGIILLSFSSLIAQDASKEVTKEPIKERKLTELEQEKMLRIDSQMKLLQVEQQLLAQAICKSVGVEDPKDCQVGNGIVTNISKPVVDNKKK